MNDNEVRLTLPASSDYTTYARVTAASLATLLGFSYDEVEDLRLAVDEVCFALIGPHRASASTSEAAEGKGTIQLTYTAADSRIEVVGILHRGVNDAPVLSELGRRILFSLVDGYELRRGSGDEPTCIRICKARSRIGAQ